MHGQQNIKIKVIVAVVSVTEKGGCSPLTNTDGVHQITKEKAERKRNRNTCDSVKEKEGEGWGKDDRGPVKNETDETHY